MFRHLACGAALAMVLAADSWAVLQHRYTFEEGNANDSAGTAHGTLEGGALIIAGQLTLPGGGVSSTPAQYANLPAATIAINTYTAATIEQWINVPTTNNANEGIGFTWSAAFGREGTATDPTDPPPTGLNNDVGEDGFGHNYIMFLATRGGNDTGRIAISRDYYNAETGANGVQMRGTGQHQFAATISSTGPDATTVTYYVDGVQLGSAIGTADLSEISNSLAYLGRSLYDGDAYFAGAINEFRIYDNALTPAEMLASFSAGPTGPAGPTLTINRDTGAMSLANLNDSMRFIDYQINSPAGALDPVDWAEITGRVDAPAGGGNGSFDADDPWMVVTQTAIQLSEGVVFGVGNGDGGSLGSVTLGTSVWEKHYAEDVNMTVNAWIDATTVVKFPVHVAYTGNGGQAFSRGDFNFDGSINGADWVTFRTNARTTLAAELTDAQSYRFGDLDGDQDVDFFDFRLFQADFDGANGVGALAAIAGAVPEPTALSLALLGVAGAAARRRRRA